MLDKLTEFVTGQGFYKDKKGKLRKLILEHLANNTFIIYKSGLEIIAVAYFNVNNNIAKVFGVLIKKGYENKYILQEIVKEIKNRFPFVEYLGWKRLLKYPKREFKYCKINNFFGLRSYDRRKRGFDKK